MVVEIGVVEPKIVMLDGALGIMVEIFVFWVMFDSAIKIVVEKTISIEMEKIAEKDGVFSVDFGFVFGVEIEGGFLVVGVVSFLVVFFGFDFVDVAVVDVGKEAAQQKLFALLRGKFELVG